MCFVHNYYFSVRLPLIKRLNGSLLTYCMAIIMAIFLLNKINYKLPVSAVAPQPSIVQWWMRYSLTRIEVGPSSTLQHPAEMRSSCPKRVNIINSNI